jgi:predicted transglutaminase-like cysteine proteinase
VFTRLRPPTWLTCALLALAGVSGVVATGGASALDTNRLQHAYSAYRGNHSQPFADWESMLQQNRNEPVTEQLRRVNEFFNRRIRFEDDQQIWGRSDYWATPMETLSRGAGDCEDFAIAKYFSLLALGVPNEQLRLVYVKARIGGPSSTVQQAHMVLAFYATPEAEPIVLDNLISDIRPASRRPDLLPVFSFNSQAIFAGVAGDAAAGPGGVGRLSRWAQLLQQVRAEGFDEW